MVEEEHTLFLSEDFHLLLASYIGIPVSQAFGLRLRFIPSAPLFLDLCMWTTVLILQPIRLLIKGLLGFHNCLNNSYSKSTLQ